MLTIGFAVIAVICAFGWLNRWVGCAALAMYIASKEYTPPTDEELRACLAEVWRRVLTLDF